MSSKRKLGANQKQELNDIEYRYVKSLKENENGVKIRQCPTGVFIIGRILQLIKDEKKSKQEAYLTVSKELQEVWIYGMNIYPKKIDNIRLSIKNIYEGRKGIDSYKGLIKIPLDRRDDKWLRRVEIFNNKMLRGFDIKTIDEFYIRHLEKEYNMDIGEDEEKLYKDNCKEKTCYCEGNEM